MVCLDILMCTSLSIRIYINQMSYTCSLNNRETELTSEMDKVKLAASKLYYWFIWILPLKLYVCLMIKDIWWFLLMHALVVTCFTMILSVSWTYSRSSKDVRVVIWGGMGLKYLHQLSFKMNIWILDDIFAMRQKRAVELKVKVDRSDNMNEQELSELRSEIKVCISDVNFLTCTHSSCNTCIQVHIVFVLTDLWSR